MRTALVMLLAWFGLAGCNSETDGEARSGSPVDDLPARITPLIDVGVRPDWSADSNRLVYLDTLVGDVYEYDLHTGISQHLTGHFEHEGFTRVRYLANGDLLLCGPNTSAASAEGGGRWQTELWFLGRQNVLPAQALGEPCFEGPAVSRRAMTIAWTRSEYPDKVIFARSEIWTGRLEVNEGRARLLDRRKRVDRSDFMYLAFVETQDFRPPNEDELLFTAYAYKGGEAMGINLSTGEIRNYSQNWGYDEAEGVFPDGNSIAVEREPSTYTAVPVGDIDIWRLALDGSGNATRLTQFSQYSGYGANNPVISPDGSKMAFGLRIKGGDHGNAQGILLYTFEMAPE